MRIIINKSDIMLNRIKIASLSILENFVEIISTFMGVRFHKHFNRIGWYI